MNEREFSLILCQDNRRFQLSLLVNHLLENEKTVPFEFLINGSFLRTSIDEYLTANGISSENTLTVEYVRAIEPPTRVASFEHDDWVSSVDVLSRTSKAGRWAGNQAAVQANQERILTGSYDGFLRVWNMSSQVLATSTSTTVEKQGTHLNSIKAARFVSPSMAISGGYDRKITIWNYAEELQAETAALTPRLELCGHRMMINSLDVHTPSSRIISASNDGCVGLWLTKKSDAPAAPVPQSKAASTKRQKTSMPQRGPLSLLKSHKEAVSSSIFAPNDHTVGYSCSMDHTMKTWDLTTSSLVDTRTTSYPLLSLMALPNLNLVAVGTTARHITLIDPRASATTVSAMTLRGHINFVSSLAPDPNNTHSFVSGSYDGTCRIWDVRSSRSDTEGVFSESVYTIPREGTNGAPSVTGEGVKVFGVFWDRDVGILSAGEDKRVQLNRAQM